MVDFEFFIPIDPLPQSRPRFTRFGHAYEAEPIRRYKQAVAVWVRSAMAKDGIRKVSKETAIELEVVFSLPTPKSWTKKRTESAQNGRMPHVSKPEIDNLLKALFDAVNGILWDDDSQVVSCKVIKRYAPFGGIGFWGWTQKEDQSEERHEFTNRLQSG